MGSRKTSAASSYDESSSTQSFDMCSVSHCLLFALEMLFPSANVTEAAERERLTREVS